MTARRRMLARIPLALAVASALAVPALAEDGMCLVEGTIQWNGVPMPDGETVLCHHSGGIAVTETDGSLDVGNYQCEVADGPVTIEVRGCSFPECPVPCDGDTGAPVRCNPNRSGCSNPCWTSAALALPPVWLRRRRRPA